MPRARGREDKAPLAPLYLDLSCYEQAMATLPVSRAARRVFASGPS